jgi:zinc protease
MTFPEIETVIRQRPRDRSRPCRFPANGKSRRTAVALAVLLSVALVRCGPAEKAGEPAVLRSELANGLRVVIVRNELAPVATTVVNYRVGSDEAPPGFPGMAHAQEHMMFRGSPGLSADQLADIAAAMGGRFDADTQQTVTQ